MVLAFPWELGERSLFVTTRGVLGGRVGTRSQSGVVVGWRPCHAAAAGLAHGLQLSSAGRVGRAVLTSAGVSQRAFPISREKASD